MEEFLIAKTITGDSVLVRRDRIEAVVFTKDGCEVSMFSGRFFRIGGDLDAFKAWYLGDGDD